MHKKSESTCDLIKIEGSVDVKPKYRVEAEENKADLVERGFEFFHSVAKENYMAINVHTHNAIEFIYVTEGSFRVSIDGSLYHATPGDLIMFRSHGIHSMVSEGSRQNGYYALKIKPKIIQDISPRRLVSKISFRFSVCSPKIKCFWSREELEGTAVKAALLRLIEEMNDEGDYTDIAMFISVSSVILGILSLDKSLDEVLPSVDTIYESITYVNSHFSEELTAEEVAKKINMSYGHFSRSFKAATGKSFKDFLNVQRTDYAEQLLLTTDLSVSAVAGLCGYNSSPYFVTIYKKYKGKTPSAERHLAGEDPIEDEKE